ncbi:DUF7312 domain-containing protein [Haladaptatus sp. NG-SE-30]
MSDWKFDVDEVGNDEVPDGAPAPEEETLEPGSPSAENVVFVILGAVTTIFVFLRILGIA